MANFSVWSEDVDSILGKLDGVIPWMETQIMGGTFVRAQGEYLAAIKTTENPFPTVTIDYMKAQKQAGFDALRVAFIEKFPEHITTFDVFMAVCLSERYDAITAIHTDFLNDIHAYQRVNGPLAREAQRAFVLSQIDTVVGELEIKLNFESENKNDTLSQLRAQRLTLAAYPIPPTGTPSNMGMHSTSQGSAPIVSTDFNIRQEK